MDHPKTPYNPANNKEETSYEFHAPKNPKELYKDKIRERARGKTWIRKLLPSLLIGAGCLWAFYTYDYFTREKDPNRDTDGSLLRDDKFLPYIVSFKYQIDPDHYLVELTRKNRAQKLIHNQRLFSGDKMWSIEIAKPDINIVRSYTPLPLFVAGVDPTTQEPHLQLVSKSEQEGKFIIIVKRYPDGEFSKWLTGLQLLQSVQVRGPITDYKFKFHPLDHYEPRPQLSNTLEKTLPDPSYPEKLPKPENFVYYGAGTGILPFLQILYSPNPPKGFSEAFFSLKSDSNILNQFKTLNYFAEKCGRVKFHYFIEDQGQKLTDKDIRSSTLPHFSGAKDLKVSEEVYRYKLLQEKKEEVRRQIEGKDVVHENVSEDSPSMEDANIPQLDLTKIKADNAFQQFSFLRKRTELPPPSLAIVCGPDGFVEAVAGKADINNVEMEDRGPIGGILKGKGWTEANVKRLV
ncbi:DEKNAAC105191 [Brettanomyces naardenensis]|uniref:DEKNAAC105191 n=1 Tax=Brettanomyces naardenensis TaxID=13370 RepID=A0A448YST6_BRENA|nr:DEKNAAC105191 [Brettanomyces naardenensis]